MQLDHTTTCSSQWSLRIRRVCFPATRTNKLCCVLRICMMLVLHVHVYIEICTNCPVHTCIHPWMYACPPTYIRAVHMYIHSCVRTSAHTIIRMHVDFQRNLGRWEQHFAERLSMPTTCRDVRPSTYSQPNEMNAED